MKALLYKGFRGILKNFPYSGTLLDSSVPYQKIKLRSFVSVGRSASSSSSLLAQFKICSELSLWWEFEKIREYSP